ncbi:hypothetical protein F2Q69_00055190 [Brassica cretica]|uniref:Uncharacterized protein n=1 Tax=Brassica cretica TaxID=69181 RepID=A0A8S9MVM9_BRACR|nr:hypothetical protein F2Q69_00055190 [Brassica cretica]
MLGAASPWVGTNSKTVPWFADFVSSPLPSMFSHLAAAFITARISGDSPFRYIRLWFLGPYLPFSLFKFVYLVSLLPLACVFLLHGDFSLLVIILPLACFLGLVLAKIFYGKVM